MKVQGWIAFVSETLSIAFLPAGKNCIYGELLDWQLLTIGQNMQRFISDFKPTVEYSGGCSCYYVDSDRDSLDDWFSLRCSELENQKGEQDRTDTSLMETAGRDN